MSKIINLIKSMAKKKEVDAVEEVETTEQESVSTEVRDADFLAKHTGAQDNVIYG